MVFEPIRIKQKILEPHKAVHGAEFGRKTVLASDPFDYVDLWLRREHKVEALYYWRQAKSFFYAASDLPIESSPLVLYYCFMNAAKALLSSKNINFNPYHGVKRDGRPQPNQKVVLSNEGFKIKTAGVVPSLISYFGESEISNTHSLEETFYNLVFIHRTYCLTYKNSSEQFLPIRKCFFARNSASGQVHLLIRPVSDANWRSFGRKLPTSFIKHSDSYEELISVQSIPWQSPANPSASELALLSQFNSDLRKDLHYINGSQTLWYLKSNWSKRINRQPVTLTISAMHRLSEVCRYSPSALQSFLDGQKNWLLSEFVSMSSNQFLDEIACEITGHQLMIPNVRAPL